MPGQTSYGPYTKEGSIVGKIDVALPWVQKLNTGFISGVDSGTLIIVLYIPIYPLFTWTLKGSY